MSKTVWTTFLAVATCAAFFIGLSVGKDKKTETASPSLPLARHDGKNSESARVPVLLAINDNLRGKLAAAQQEVQNLTAELAELGAELPPPLTPEEEKVQAEYDEWMEKRKLTERRKALNEKCNELRKKILQRKDKALRQDGLLELASLTQSDDTEELLLGLTTLPRLWGFDFDKESFRPNVLAALEHQDHEARIAALRCTNSVCSREEQRDIIFSLAKDPSPEVRAEAASRLAWFRGPDPKQPDEQVASLMKELLQDEDNTVKRRLLDSLRSWGYGYDYGQEMEDTIIEMSRDKEMAVHVQRWLFNRRTIDARMAQRLVEMYDEGRSGYYNWEWTNRNLSEDAKPIASQLCLRVVEESIEHYERHRALENIRRIGDFSVLPRLEQLADTNDAEGIEDQLTETIEYLQKKARAEPGTRQPERVY